MDENQPADTGEPRREKVKVTAKHLALFGKKREGEGITPFLARLKQQLIEAGMLDEETGKIDFQIGARRPRRDPRRRREQAEGNRPDR